MADGGQWRLRGLQCAKVISKRRDGEIWLQSERFPTRLTKSRLKAHAVKPKARGQSIGLANRSGKCPSALLTQPRRAKQGGWEARPEREGTEPSSVQGHGGDHGACSSAQGQYCFWSRGAGWAVCCKDRDEALRSPLQPE